MAGDSDSAPSQSPSQDHQRQMPPVPPPAPSLPSSPNSSLPNPESASAVQSSVTSSPPISSVPFNTIYPSISSSTPFTYPPLPDLLHATLPIQHDHSHLSTPPTVSTLDSQLPPSTASPIVQLSSPSQHILHFGLPPVANDHNFPAPQFQVTILPSQSPHHSVASDSISLPSNAPAPTAPATPAAQVASVSSPVHPTNPSVTEDPISDIQPVTSTPKPRRIPPVPRVADSDNFSRPARSPIPSPFSSKSRAKRSPANPKRKRNRGRKLVTADDSDHHPQTDTDVDLEPTSKLSLDIDDSDKDPPVMKFTHRVASLFLTSAMSTGEIGRARREVNTVDFHMLTTVIKTAPWMLLLVQLIWSTVVTGIAYGIAQNINSGLSKTSQLFWTTHISVPSQLVYALGWALFVLLGYFIREASHRYQEGQNAVHAVGTHLRQLVRHLRQVYPPGTWHTDDHERIVAHIVAYPIALKMNLRSERDPSQLDRILYDDDLRDLLNADLMHLHCSRVIRAYFSAAERFLYTSSATEISIKPIAGDATRFFIIAILDAVDVAANCAVRVAEFRPAVVYVNHLRIFLYIWLMFLPLALLRNSGWYVQIHFLHRASLCPLSKSFGSNDNLLPYSIKIFAISKP